MWSTCARFPCAQISCARDLCIPVFGQGLAFQGITVLETLKAPIIQLPGSKAGGFFSSDPAGQSRVEVLSASPP